MNVSNGCHSARTIGQFSIAHGFAMAYHLWFHPDGGWPSDTKHHSWTSHSQKVWYCVSKGIGFQPKGGGRHRQAPSAAFKCFRQSGSEGIIDVRTCRLIFFGWLASIHHSIGTLTRCIDTWLCNGFASMVSAWLGICMDLQRFLLYLHECLQRLSLGQNNWPIACNKWFHHDCAWRDALEL